MNEKGSIITKARKALYYWNAALGMLFLCVGCGATGGIAVSAYNGTLLENINNLSEQVASCHFPASGSIVLESGVPYSIIDPDGIKFIGTERIAIEVFQVNDLGFWVMKTPGWSDVAVNASLSTDDLEVIKTPDMEFPIFTIHDDKVYVGNPGENGQLEIAQSCY